MRPSRHGQTASSLTRTSATRGVTPWVRTAPTVCSSEGSAATPVPASAGPATTSKTACVLRAHVEKKGRLYAGPFYFPPKYANSSNLELKRKEIKPGRIKKRGRHPRC